MEIANEMEEKAKKKGKCWYDKKARDVIYEVGEQVLLLLPLIGKPLQAIYREPHTVVKRLGEVDYFISTADRRKAKRIVHVNLLRKFLTRPSVSQVSPVALVGSSVSVQDNCDDQFWLVNLDHLQLEQRGQLTTLLDRYRPIFSDTPCRTTVVQHCIILVPNACPVRQAPY